MKKYLFLILAFIGCSSVAIDPRENSGAVSGSGEVSSVSSSVASTSGSGGFGGMTSTSSANSSSGSTGGCELGQQIPDTDGGPNGGLSICCDESKEKQCNLLCCESVTYDSEGHPINGHFCQTNPELGLCCPLTSVCLPKP